MTPKQRFLVALALAVGATSTVCAQSYPSRPIRFIVGFVPGGVADLLARALAQKLTDAWGQQVVADNRPSAGGTVAGSIVAGAAPDGYTLLITSSAFAGSAALYDKLPYDTLKDFAGVMQIASTPLIITVTPALGLKSLKDLIALAKQKPRQLNFASSGIGSGTHYGAALIVKSTAKHAYIFENGTQVRKNAKGANRGAMPPGRVFVPTVIRKRKQMLQELKYLLVQAGLDVRGDA